MPAKPWLASNPPMLCTALATSSGVALGLSTNHWSTCSCDTAMIYAGKDETYVIDPIADGTAGYGMGVV